MVRVRYGQLEIDGDNCRNYLKNVYQAETPKYHKTDVSDQTGYNQIRRHSSDVTFPFRSI